MRIEHDRVVFRGGFRLAATVPLLCRLLFSAACFVSLAPAARGEPFRLPRADRFEVYEALRGNLDEAEGYLFSVSPDEQWIAVVRRDAPPFHSCLVVLHRPTRRTWDFMPPDDESRWKLGWRPDCFSADGKRIYFADRVAALSPSMETLDFRPAPPIPNSQYFEGFFVGRIPYVVDGERGRAGRMVSSPNGKTLYESVVSKQVRTSFLRTTLPDREVRVDYDAVYDAFNGETKRLADRIRASAKQQDAALKPEQRRILQELASMFHEADEPSAAVELTDLAISPDGRLLAGVAELDLDDGEGSRYGVVIPLDRGGFAAFPFAENVWGKPMWSADSTAIYFYAQPTHGGGYGTVHRLAVSSLALPARIPETAPPYETPPAPSDRAIAPVADMKTIDDHYELLHAEFSKPQTIREFRGRWGLTENGQVFEVFETRHIHGDGLERYVAANLLHRPVKLVLPDREDFTRSYIPGARTGAFGDATRYPSRRGPAGAYGVVPVLLYDAEGLVNSKFEKSESLRKYR